MKWKILILILSALCLTTVRAVAKDRNIVVTFLSGSEIQCEDASQKSTLIHVLSDLLTKTPSEMPRLRYPDYEGHPASWSASEVLEHYVVPAGPQPLYPGLLYRDAKSPQAIEAIRNELDILNQDSP